MCLHVILPNYSSHPIPSIFCLDKGGGVRFPEGFGKTSKAVEAGVDVSGVAGGAVFHGQVGVGGGLVIQRLGFASRNLPFSVSRNFISNGGCSGAYGSTRPAANRLIEIPAA